MRRPSQLSGITCALAAAALMAAGCHSQSARPSSSAASPAADSTATQDPKLQLISDAFRKFHEDTGGWPLGGGVWNASTSQQVDALRFDKTDTALFTLPKNARQCQGEGSRPCWNGPYLPGKSLADAAYLDQWGHAAEFMLLRPRDGMGGGNKLAPNGLVVIWSTGPDGKDGFGCSDASCVRDSNRMATGTPSKAHADDMVAVLGPIQ
jgi:hypothetical protein